VPFPFTVLARIMSAQSGAQAGGPETGGNHGNRTVKDENAQLASDAISVAAGEGLVIHGFGGLRSAEFPFALANTTSKILR